MAEPIVTTSLARIQTDPNASDSPIATAFFQKTTVIDDQTFIAPWTAVTWELQSHKTVTIGGVEYPYYLVSQLVVAIADQEYAASLVPPVEPPAEA